MRHFLANIMTYTLAALLLLGAGVFAWVRSAQVVITDEYTVLQRYDYPDDRAAGIAELGARSYVRNCLSCHAADGRGWDQYPPIIDSGKIARQPGGRDYLIDLHLYGLTSDRWGAPMPPMGHMHDIELAAVLTHITRHWDAIQSGAPVPAFEPDEIAARRDQRKTPWQVNDTRPAGAD